MSAPIAVTAFGEIIADGFPISSDTRSHDPDTYQFRLGGAPVNTAAGVALLGGSSAVIAKTGNDPIGKQFVEKLARIGVSTKYMLQNPAVATTKSLVSLSSSGDRSFRFIHGAHDTIRADEVTLPETNIFHFGSLLQIKKNAEAATSALLAQAARRDITISYDPNIRMSLWKDASRAGSVIRATIPHVRILKMSEEEAVLLAGETDPGKAATKIMTPGNDIVIITLAGKGCYWKTKHDGGHLPTIAVTAIDTTGAGDAFNAGFLWCLSGSRGISHITKPELLRFLRTALVAGSLTTTKYGAIDAFPSRKDIEAYHSFING